MAYVNGSATSVTDLLSALQAACTANGWTLSGSVLHKGACYVQVNVVSGYLVILGGTGIDGSNALTGAGPYVGRIGVAWTGDSLTFPVTYAVHIGATPDEVYLLINYESTRWQWMAFGCSPVTGLPGTGNWYGASVTRSINSFKCSISPTTGGEINALRQSMALFWNTSNNYQCSFFHHGLDGNTWSGDNENVTDSTSAINAISPASPFVSRLPNQWNGEITLIPIQPCISRGSSKQSIAGDVAHARYVRVDNYVAGDIITLGSDQWKVYPWHQKNVVQRDGGLNLNHSGTLGWAIRYDGP